MTVQLIIDNREVEIEDGKTVLDAARKLGIEIPTLCHLDGLPPASSCLLCVVRIKGQRNLVPSCSARAEEGMVVTTMSDEIHNARRTALELLLSDHVGDCVASCTLSCPAGMDIAAMIGHIRDGHHEKALSVIMEHIPLPGVLGRICPRFCERACRRKDLDEPVAICALKRFPSDYVEANGSETPSQPSTGKKVAIIGAGVAGLSAAYYLLREGHACTLIDANEETGGGLRYAVPAFRLPREALDKDIDAIRALGAEFQRNTRVNDAAAFKKLRADFDAVLLATGAAAGVPSECAAADLALSGGEFLYHVHAGQISEMDGRVLVLGGGEDAVDAARVALRLGATEVSLVWEGDRASMPCFDELVDDAEQEGVRLNVNCRPLKIGKDSTGQYTVSCLRHGEEVAIEASSVILAPKRAVDLDFLQALGLETSRRGAAADRHTFATSMEGVYAAGEVVTGPAAAVRAVRSGRLAALGIHAYLQGRSMPDQPGPVNVHMRDLNERELATLHRGFPKAPRARQQVLPPDGRRKTFAEVVSGLDEETAVREAARCMQCDCLAKDDCRLRDYATEYGASPRAFRGERRAFERDVSHPKVAYEPGKCIMCGLCVRIAAEAGEGPGIAFLGRGFTTKAGVPFGGTLAEGLPTVAERCARACPTGALALKPHPDKRMD